MRTTHSYSAWAALQHGISAVFALATWQFAAEGVDEGVSERSTEFGHHWLHVARVLDHSPLPVTLLEKILLYFNVFQRVTSTPAYGPHEELKNTAFVGNTGHFVKVRGPS